jgi:hypothetical protein
VKLFQAIQQEEEEELPPDAAAEQLGYKVIFISIMQNYGAICLVCAHMHACCANISVFVNVEILKS